MDRPWAWEDLDKIVDLLAPWVLILIDQVFEISASNDIF